jgi:hypothetical protein
VDFTEKGLYATRDVRPEIEAVEEREAAAAAPGSRKARRIEE